MEWFSKLTKLKSFLILPVTAVVVVWVNFNITKWKQQDVIQNDIINYYSYLPALFYEQDIELNFLNDSVTNELESRYYWPNTAPNGKKIIKYSMGMAVSYLPFFACAHLYCVLSGETRNGFSTPYHVAVQFSSLAYVLVGLYFLVLLLRQYFNEKIIFIALCSVLFGTNLLYYTTIGAGMPHATNFGFVALFLYFIPRWHAKPSLLNSILIGLVFGLLVLIRPVNALFILIFLFYKLNSLSDLKIQIKFFLKSFWPALVVAFVAFLVFLPQLLYWKKITSSFIFNSYVGETFFFSQPHILDGLFSFRKGWLVYTPLMFFALLGMLSLKKHVPCFLWSILLFFPLFVYTIFSWWCWWYGGSFGQRTMIDAYPLLLLPLAAFLSQLQSFSKFLKISSMCGIACCFLLNIFQTMQAKWNIIHYDSMTKAAYNDAFFRITKNPEREKFLKHPDYEKAVRGLKEE